MSEPTMTTEEAVAALDAIDLPGDPEAAHSDADAILRSAADPRVALAYAWCISRTGRWWFA